MTDPCENCERLQPRSVGTAPLRQPFCQPTMYDHMKDFIQFTDAKEKANKIKAAKDNLLTFNTRFTDLQLPKDDETLENFSTQSIAKFRKLLKENKFKGDEEPLQAEDEWEAQYELSQAKSLTAISSSPFFCPVTMCTQTIGSTALLSHFLRDHNKKLKVQYQNVYSGGRAILLLHRQTFQFGKTMCKDVILYGGDQSDVWSRPVLRGLCKQNSFLPKPYTHLEHYLPILVLGCMTSYWALLKNKKHIQPIVDPKNDSTTILVIWLLSTQTTSPIHVTLSVFDENMTSTRSATIKVRGLELNQNPDEFLTGDPNYLMLNEGDLNILSGDGKQPIHMEIQIVDFKGKKEIV